MLSTLPFFLYFSFTSFIFSLIYYIAVCNFKKVIEKKVKSEYE